MQSNNAGRHRLGESQARHFTWLIIGHLSGQGRHIKARQHFRQGNLKAQRVQHNLTGGLLHLHGDGFFAREFLPFDIRIKKQLVMAGNNGFGQPLPMNAGGYGKQSKGAERESRAERRESQHG